MIVSLRDRAMQISWFLLREIIEVATFRSAIESYWIKHDPFGTVAFSYEALQNFTYQEVTQTLEHNFCQSPLLGIGWSKVGTQSTDFERDLYDLGQNHDGNLYLIINNVLMRRK